MLSATTLTQQDETGFDFGNPMDLIGTAANMGGKALAGQGGALGTIGQLAGGIGQIAGGGGAPSGGGGGGVGSSIGGIAGGALGSLLGPAGTALGGLAGGAIGGAIEGLLNQGPSPEEAAQTRRIVAQFKDAQRNLEQAVWLKNRAHDVASMTPSERAVWDGAVALSTKLKSRAPREDAWLKIWNPTQYEAQARDGRTPMQLFDKARAAAEDQRRRDREKKLTVREKAEHDLLFQGLSGFQKIRLENALHKGQAAQVYKQIQSEIAAERAKAATPRASAATAPAVAPPQASKEDDASTDAEIDAAQRVLSALATPQSPLAVLDEASGPDDEASGPDDEASGVDDEASGPTTTPDDKRPRPVRHISLIPLQQHQLAEMLRRVPVLQKLDPRSLQLLAGRSSVARDVAGVDPATRTFHADVGATATGIAKQLTGNAERAVELLAANPGHQEREWTWRIPPGWLVYDRADTAGITTQRKYVVQNGDFPMKIADRLGAKASHGAWWRELKDANPDKATVDGGANWKGLFAGEELGVPDSWPLSPLAVPNGTGGLIPNVPSVIPGAPSLPFPIPNMPSSFPTVPGAPSFPMPGFPGVPSTNATQDAGVILQSQGMLAYFAQTHPGIISPPDFGKQAADFTGMTAPRSMQALQSFQLWWDAGNPMNAVRVDGVLDDPTYRALYSATAGQIQRPMQQGPMLPPNAPQIPIPNGDILPANVPTIPMAPIVPMSSTGPASPIPGMNQPQGPIGTQVPGLPPGWTWTTPDGPFGSPWQAPPTPAPRAPAQTASSDSSSSGGGGGIALAGLAAAALALL